MEDRLRVLRGEITEDQLAIEKFAASAPEALRDAARAAATETLTLERQVQQITAAFDAGGQIVGDFFEGIILGTRSAGESLQAFKGILARTLIQGLLDVAKAAAISSVTGGSVSVQGAGGAVIGALGGLVNGGGFSGALSGAVQGGFGGGASLGGSGGGGFKIPSTFGIGSIAQKVLGIGAGTGAGAFGAGGFLFNLPVAAAGSAGSGLIVPTITNGAIAASPGFSAAQSSFTLGAAGTAPSAPASALSGLAGYAGLALALGLGAKGIADTRSGYSDLTMGTSQAAMNRLSGIQGATIAAFTGGGAAIGSAVPGIGTVIGAGVGAAVGAAVSNAIAEGTMKGISTSLQKGLGQKGLEKEIVKELKGDWILNILSGGQNAAFAAELFGPMAAPDINRIFGKVFRQTLGGPGGLDTTDVTVGNRGSYGMPELRGPAGQASRIIAQAMGAGGAAFNERREDFISILLGGIAKRMKQSGGDGADILAEAFIGAFNGRFFKALRTVNGNVNATVRDTAFAVEQFRKASPAFGLNYDAIARNVAEVGVPAGKAVKQSRAAFGEAFKEALTNAADSDAFRKSLSKSFVSAFVERTAGALSQGPLGEAFADIFAISRENKKELKKARRANDSEGILNITVDEFQKDVDEFAKRVSDPAFLSAMTQMNNELLKLSLNVSIATGNISEAVDTLTARLAPAIATVREAQQLQRDVKSRVAFLQAGPGFGQSQTQVDELRRQRIEQEGLLESRFGGNITNLRNILSFDKQFGGNRAGQLRLQDPDALLAAFRSFAEARLSELEAEAGLARQIRDFYRDTRENFARFREGIDVIRNGPRAQLDILRDRRAEISRLLPVALGPDSEAQQRALAKIQEFLPEILQLGQGLFAPGSSQFQGLLAFADQIATQLGLDAGNRESAADKRLNDAKAQAEAFKADIVPLLGLIELAAANNLNLQFDRLVAILGGDGATDGIKQVLETVRDNIVTLTGGGTTQQGGALNGFSGAGGSNTAFGATNASTTNRAADGSASATITVPIAIQVTSSNPEAAVDAVEDAIRRKRPQLVAEIRRAVAGGR
jgi:hypothetical protein